MKKEYCGFPMRIAHTGVTQFAPENSLEAFKKTAELGFEGIELDIQLSGDGEIIVIHNNNMGYMTLEMHQDVLKELTTEPIRSFLTTPSSKCRSLNRNILAGSKSVALLINQVYTSLLNITVSSLCLVKYF